jgi:hypothetical protein
MDRMHSILKNVTSILAASAQKTYDGQERNDLKDSDFLFPETRSFPIVSPTDVKDAISNYGRMSGKMSYEDFLHKLYNMCKRKGPEFIAALPEASKEKLAIEDKNSKADIFDMVLSPQDDSTDDSSVDENQMKIDELYEMAVSYLKSVKAHVSGILNAIDSGDEDVKENLTEPWLQDKIALVANYVQHMHDFLMFTEMDDDTTEASKKKKKHHERLIKTLPIFHNTMMFPTMKKEEELNEDKVTSPNNEDNEENEDTEEESSPTMSEEKPGLWDNIRKKKEREGKKYRPAKRGDKDRPDPKMWKQLTEGNTICSKCGLAMGRCMCS